MEEYDDARKRDIQIELLRFKEELDKKKEARREALNSLGRRMADLRLEKDREKEEKEKLQVELLQLKMMNSQTMDRLKTLEIELKDVREEKEMWQKEAEEAKRAAAEERLDSMKGEEVEGLERQVKALKDVAAISAEMLKIREMQVR